MAIVEAVQCPAGHPQDHVRADRPGRCTKCGGSLVRAAYDDALPAGKTLRGEFIADSEDEV